MNRNRFSIKTLTTYCGAAVVAFGLLFTAQSCQESINEGNFAIAQNPTITEHLVSNDSIFSSIKAIFDRVKLGSKDNASVLSSVLSARGNYTVFAPTNKAVEKYLQTLGKSKIEELTKEEATLIAYSCVIDNGDETAYSRQQLLDGALSKTDLSDRSITVKNVPKDEANKIPAHILLNDQVKIVGVQEKLSNGYLHTVESVIAPSIESVPDLLQAAPNMRIMGALLDATDWANKLSGTHFDLQYEGEERELTTKLEGVAGTFNIPQHRYLCFTGFVETDEVFQKEWGIPAPQYDEGTKTLTNAQAIIDAVKAKCEAIYGTDAQNDLKDEANAVNRFVAYHFLEGKMAHNQFVQHFNEWLYQYKDKAKPQQSTYTIDISDYFVTVGSKRALMKITQDAKSHNIYINRTCKYDVNKDYEQLQVLREGVQVFATNEVNGKTYDNNSKNGYFFPINKILVMDKETAAALGSERIRFDITTMLPELLSSGCRTDLKYTHFPKLTSARADGTRGFFRNIINESEGTRFAYLHAGDPQAGGGWRDYQGDEFMVLGLYDFVLKLPPVPEAGMYEIRMGTSNNTLRGMCQIYFGDDPNNLTPAGLPLDMRQTAADNPLIGFKGDTKDADANAETDKNMRNQGYMKAPRSFTVVNGKGDAGLRDFPQVLRRIITQEYMEPGKTYYLRFKSALDKSDSQFFSDYFELVPRSVFNGQEPEDLW